MRPPPSFHKEKKRRRKRKKKREGEREREDGEGALCLRCGSARIWSNVGGIEAVEVITDIGHILSRYQASEANKNACGEELHGCCDFDFDFDF